MVFSTSSAQDMPITRSQTNALATPTSVSTPARNNESSDAPPPQTPSMAEIVAAVISQLGMTAPGDKDRFEVARALKDLIPQYSGTQNAVEIRSLFSKLDAYFNCLPSLQDVDKIAIACSRLTHHADVWWSSIVRDPIVNRDILSNYAIYQKSLRSRFFTAEHERLLLESLHSLCQGRDSVADYAAKFQNMALQLDGINEHILVATFLRGLNPSIRRLVKTNEGNLRNLHVLIEASLRQSENATNTEQTASEASAQRRKPVNEKYECGLCGAKGHTSRYCKKVDDFIRSAKQTSSPDAPIAMMTSVAPTSTVSFLVDSGCTQHMVPNLYGIQNFSTHDTAIRVANKEELRSSYMGELSGHINQLHVILRNVLVVPQLSRALLSVTALIDNGFRVDFSLTACTIWKNNVLVATAPRLGTAYFLEVHVTEVSAMETTTIERLHQRFGHPGKTRLDKMLVSSGYKCRTPHDFACESCAKGKAVRLPFVRSSPPSTLPLQLLHIDVCGPLAINSMSDFRYIVTFTDDYSKFLAISLLSSKSSQELLNSFVSFLRMAEWQTGHKLQKLRSDNGTEFHSISTFCQANGIIHQTTVRHSPASNGVAERANHTLFSLVRTILFDSNLPTIVWNELLHCAVHLHNISPTGEHGILPYRLFRSAPDERLGNYSYLRQIGSLAHAVNTEQKGKLDSRTLRAFLVGYGQHSKSYRLYHPESHSVFDSRDLTFFEDTVFPEDLRLKLNEEHGVTDIPDFDLIPFDDPVNQEFLVKEILNERGTRRRKEYLVRWQNSAFPDEWEPAANVEGCDALLKWQSRHNHAFVSTSPEPVSLSDVVSAPDVSRWMDAVNDELASLLENDVWDVVPFNKSKKVVSVRWVLRKKTDSVGEISRYKARLVARGFTQRESLDFDEIYSPTLCKQTLRCVLGVAASSGFRFRQLDVKTAFLHGVLQHDVYIRFPPLLQCSSVDASPDTVSIERGNQTYFVEESPSNIMCKLKRGLYGLRQSPRLWYQRIDSFLIDSLHFQRSSFDSCLYLMKRENIVVAILTIYVDDILLCCSSENLETEIIEKLGAEFKLNDLGTASFLLGFTLIITWMVSVYTNDSLFKIF